MIVFLGLLTPTPIDATCWQCGFNVWIREPECTTVPEGTVGREDCELRFTGLLQVITCFEDGTFCTGISVSGGGGQGSGDNQCVTMGPCPIQCMSCSRPVY